MADSVKWIKMTTDLFNNRKIKQIRKMPEGDAIIGVWLQILCLAGELNNGGLVYFSQDIPYTDEMLATEFERPINIIRLALHTFEAFKMVYLTDDVICVSNWEKYQSTDKLEEIREKNRLRQQKYRENQKQLLGNVTVALPVTDSSISISNSISNSNKDLKDIYGEFENVKLSIGEYEKLTEKFPNTYEEMIDNLSVYIKSKGDKYKSHYATILNWSRMESKKSSNPFKEAYLQEERNEQKGNNLPNGDNQNSLPRILPPDE
jgi:predicted phage replisome organizer